MNGYWQLWNPRISSFKNNTKATKICLSTPGWLQPSSNGKQDLKFITQEHSVQQQGKCWCRPNIFSAYCKFYFRVITLVISDCAWEQHEANPAFWLANQVALGPFVLCFCFYGAQLRPGPKNAKKNMINIQPSWPHTTYIYWRKESAM